jgi:hypothetical protein
MRVEALERTSISLVEMIEVDRRSPLGIKEWSQQAFRKEMWQEKVSMRSVSW